MQAGSKSLSSGVVIDKDLAHSQTTLDASQIKWVQPYVWVSLSSAKLRMTVEDRSEVGLSYRSGHRIHHAG